MAGITALLSDGQDWCVLGEVQTEADLLNVTKLWLCNFSGSSKTFTIDLPNAGSFQRSVMSGQRAYVREGTDFTSQGLYFRLSEFADQQVALRLYDGDNCADPSCFTA